MDFKHQVFSIISEFTGQNNIITVNVTLVDFVGDLETGLFLSQMIYWSDRTKRKDGFFYKTDDEWQQEVMLSKYSVRKARKKLEELQLLETKVMKANGNPTVHYKFNKNRFCELFISFLRNRKNQFSNTEEPIFENEISLTDITTDTTTDITTINNTNNAFAFYEQNFGLINSFLSDSIGQWIDDLNEELVIEAMKRTLKQQKQWAYCEAILKDWASKKIKTIQDVQALDVQFERNRQQRYSKKLTRQEVLPDWFDEAKSKLNTPVQTQVEDTDIEAKKREIESMLKVFDGQ